MARTGSMWAPKAPASRMSGTSLMSACSRSRSMPARRAALARLHGADVVLGDRQPDRLGLQHVAEGAVVGHDAGRPGRVGGDGAVAVGDPGQEHLGDHLDDSRAAQPRDLQPGPVQLLGESGLVGPELAADDLEPGLPGAPIDPHPLHRAGGGPLAAADLGALEGRAGRAGRGQHPFPVAQHDLGVGAHVHHQHGLLGSVGPLGQGGRGRVGADVAGDARPHVQRGVGQVDPDVGGPSPARPRRW